MLRRSLFVACLALLAGCTGEDPVAFREGGTTGSTSGGGTTSGGTSGAPGTGTTPDSQLTLEGEPLSLTAGQLGTLVFNVTNRRDVGELSFKVTGLPEGVNGPLTIVLPADAPALSLPLQSLPQAVHGDYAITVEANGKPFKATTTLTMRGTAGAPDTGFGGTDAKVLIKAPAGPLKVTTLNDEHIVVGAAAGGEVKLYVLDAKGSSGDGAPLVTLPGKLRDVRGTADGGFVVLVEDEAALKLGWYGPNGAPSAPTLVLSANTVRAAKLAVTPKGVLFAQANPARTAIIIKRFAMGKEDDTFQQPPITVDNDNSADVLFLAGTSTGAAWLSYLKSFQTEQLRYVKGAEPAVPPLTYGLQVPCTAGAAVGDDVVMQCGGDPPPTIRRYSLKGSAIELAEGYGVKGVAYASGLPSMILAPSTDRIYVGHSQNGKLTLNAFDGRVAARNVFADSGTLVVEDSDDAPVATTDARGRIIVANNRNLGFDGDAIMVRRYWD